MYIHSFRVYYTTFEMLYNYLLVLLGLASHGIPALIIVPSKLEVISSNIATRLAA